MLYEKYEIYIIYKKIHIIYRIHISKFFHLKDPVIDNVFPIALFEFAKLGFYPNAISL
jgi:hypothetical protein